MRGARLPGCEGEAGRSGGNQPQMFSSREAERTPASMETRLIITALALLLRPDAERYTGMV